MITAALLVVAAAMSASPERFADLEAALVGRPAEGDALVRAYIERAGGTPVVEGTTAVILAAGDPARPPRVLGDFNGWGEGAAGTDRLARLGETRYFFRRVELPRDARIEYVLATAEGEVPDPLNPRRVAGFAGPQSELRMPGYSPVAEPVEEAPGPARGRIVSFDHESALLGNTRRVQVYLPPGYDADGEQVYPTAWLGDGTTYVERVGAPRILDALMGRGRLEPLIAILVDPVDRRVEYGVNPGFRRMMLEELVPLVAARFRVEARAGRRLAAGGSRGGQAALDLCFAAPETFGLCGAWAPAIAPRSARELLGDRQARGRFVLLRALYDDGFGGDATALRDLLSARGARVDYLEAPQGHNQGSWPDLMARVLITAFPGRMRD